MEASRSVAKDEALDTVPTEYLHIETRLSGERENPAPKLIGDWASNVKYCDSPAARHQEHSHVAASLVPAQGTQWLTKGACMPDSGPQVPH